MLIVFFFQFEIRALAVWGRARFLSVTEASHNTEFHTWMGKKHFCFFQTAETGNRTPNSSVKDSGANHYPKPCVCVKLRLVGSWDFAYCWHNVTCSVDSVFICWQLLQSQKKRHVDPMLGQCWSTVFDAGQHWSSIGSMCCVGCSSSQTAEWVRQCIYRDGLMAASRLLYQGCWTEKYSGPQEAYPMLFWCWPSVVDGGPTPRQHWLIVSGELDTVAV